MAENIPPELMKLVQGKQGTQNPPRTSPMSIPQQNEGEKQSALPKVIMAMKVLEGTLQALGADSSEGQAVLNALKTLGTKFGESGREKGSDRISSELANLVSGLPQGARQNVAPQQPQQGMQPGAPAPQM